MRRRDATVSPSAAAAKRAHVGLDAAAVVDLADEDEDDRGGGDGDGHEHEHDDAVDLTLDDDDDDAAAAAAPAPAPAASSTTHTTTTGKPSRLPRPLIMTGPSPANKSLSDACFGDVGPFSRAKRALVLLWGWNKFALKAVEGIRGHVAGAFDAVVGFGTASDDLPVPPSLKNHVHFVNSPCMMHAKLVLVEFEHGLRFVLSSANVEYAAQSDQTHVLGQSVFVQDFPRRLVGRGSSGAATTTTTNDNHVGCDLTEFLQRCATHVETYSAAPRDAKTRLRHVLTSAAVEWLPTFDMSSAWFRLVGSVAFVGGSGLANLAAVLRSALKSDVDAIDPKTVRIVLQGSSLQSQNVRGSKSDDVWLVSFAREVHRAACGFSPWRHFEALPLKRCVVLWHTANQMRGHQRSDKVVAKQETVDELRGLGLLRAPVVSPSFKGRAVLHSKIMLVVSSSGGGEEEKLEAVVMGSHNPTQAAWGKDASASAAPSVTDLSLVMTRDTVRVGSRFAHVRGARFSCVGGEWTPVGFDASLPDFRLTWRTDEQRDAARAFVQLPWDADKALFGVAYGDEDVPHVPRPRARRTRSSQSVAGDEDDDGDEPQS